MASPETQLKEVKNGRLAMVCDVWVGVDGCGSVGVHALKPLCMCVVHNAQNAQFSLSSPTLALPILILCPHPHPCPPLSPLPTTLTHPSPITHTVGILGL